MNGINFRHWPGDTDRPALALHCMMGSASYWGPIADRLGGRVDLRGFDMPGHGRSEAHIAIDRLPVRIGSGQRLVLTGNTTATLDDRLLQVTGRLFVDEGVIDDQETRLAALRTAESEALAQVALLEEARADAAREAASRIEAAEREAAAALGQQLGHGGDRVRPAGGVSRDPGGRTHRAQEAVDGAARAHRPSLPAGYDSGPEACDGRDDVAGFADHRAIAPRRQQRQNGAVPSVQIKDVPDETHTVCAAARHWPTSPCRSTCVLG